MPAYRLGSVLSLFALGAAAVAPMAQIRVKINFELPSSSTPMGYLKDIGAPFSASTGRGWVTEASLSTLDHVPADISADMRDRNVSGVDRRLNTFAHMQKPTGPYAYEYAVPNGVYTVVVAVGDPSTFDSRHYVNVEGVSVISNFTPTTATRFKVDSTVIQVTDGLLTVDAVGGSNTKLCYLHIASQDAPPDPPPVDLRINFQNSTAPIPAGYVKDYGQAYGLRTEAGQGAGLRYGWVVPGTSTPLNLTTQGRERATPADRRLATLMHMHWHTSGSWEIAVPNGYYTVTVSMGDEFIDSRHRLTIEGTLAVPDFVPTRNNRYFSAAKVVQVTDGRLTLDGTGGSNCKLNYVHIQSGISPAGRPSIGLVSPASGSTGANRSGAVAAEVILPAGPINAATVSSATARLIRSNDNAVIPASVNTSGGGDVVVIQPATALAETTGYRYEFTDGLQDINGRPFLPTHGHFITGTSLIPPTAQIFDPVSLGSEASGYDFTTLAIGPGSTLYAGTLTGEILRFPINPDGSLGARQLITSVISANGGVAQAIIGMVFDPAATLANPILWITANDRNLSDAPDWSGKVVRLSGANLETVANYVVGLPRARRDHMSNSLVWGPDGALYLSQGSRSANGAYDGTWRGEERLLSAAILRIDLNAIATPPLDVKTEEGGTYDPKAPGAPVTLYATGIRNAYDLVWHTNGSLYVSGNGSAAGGYSPATPTPLPAACADRIDNAQHGPYTGPSVAPINGNSTAQVDMLYRVLPGRYYGHPNPRRCEWVLNGGNPTSGIDLLEEPQYPVGTLPDRNWHPPAFDYGEHFSPNGIIEYRNNRFSGALQGKMMVARYSGGKDILVMSVNPATLAISSSEVLNTGGVKFGDPLDLVENTANGYLYVAEYAGRKITLLRPR